MRTKKQPSQENRPVPKSLKRSSVSGLTQLLANLKQGNPRWAQFQGRSGVTLVIRDDLLAAIEWRGWVAGKTPIQEGNAGKWLVFWAFGEKKSVHYSLDVALARVRQLAAGGELVPVDGDYPEEYRNRIQSGEDNGPDNGSN